MTGNGSCVNLLKLAWKSSWNHIKWTYFWRVLAIFSHCVPLFTAKKLCSNFAWNKLCVMWGDVSLLILFILFYWKTYRKKSEIWPQTTLGRSWVHWAYIKNIRQKLGTFGRHTGYLVDIVNIRADIGEIGDIGQTYGTLGRNWADIGQILGIHWISPYFL